MGRRMEAPGRRGRVGRQRVWEGRLLGGGFRRQLSGPRRGGESPDPAMSWCIASQEAMAQVRVRKVRAGRPPTRGRRRTRPPLRCPSFGSTGGVAAHDTLGAAASPVHGEKYALAAATPSEHVCGQGVVRRRSRVAAGARVPSSQLHVCRVAWFVARPPCLVRCPGTSEAADPRCPGVMGPAAAILNFQLCGFRSFCPRAGRR